MKNALIAVFLLLISCGMVAAQDGGFFPFEYRALELENGFKAYLIEAGAPGQIAYVTIVRTGSREEWEPGRSGFAHFFEHVMFRGTEKYPNFDDVITRMGGSSNAFTSNDMTVYHIVASSDSLEQLVDLESDRFQNLAYDEASFRTEAGAVLGEFNQGRANPFSFLSEKVYDTAYDKHTYKHTTIGFEQDVRAMPEGFEYSRTFFERYYRPENVVLLLVGDFDEARAEELILAHYSDWKPGYIAPEIEPEPQQQAARTGRAIFPGRTLPILSLTWKGPPWSASDKMAVAAEVLGQVAFGQNSEIYRKLVIQDQTVQAFFANFLLSRDPDLLAVFAMVGDPAKLDSVRSEIESTIAQYRDQLCDADQLEATKSNMRYGYLMGLETAENVAFSLLGPVVNTGRLEPINDYYRTLDSITPDDLREAARAFLVDSGRTEVTLVSEGGN